ncbi:MAG: hypothetical protein QME62_08215, partial [Armatimonadota bacterium]|nr:hypothetical protein [Armatimonadota bacterium]
MSPNKIPRIPLLIAVLFLFILVIGMFADVLFTSKSIVLSDKEQDLARQGLHWRAFGFGELRRGNLPLWNPHQFSGVPFFGSFQSALLYPLNIIYLFLPLAKAVNIDFALNVFLAGLFALLWAYYRRLNPPACILVAVLYMFGPAYFLHIFSGHLTVISTAAWIPLILLVVDGIVDNPSPNWCLLGIFAVAMQILAGYPQYAFYTGVTALIYLALNLIGVNRRAKVVACFVSIYVGAALLTAVQVFAGLQAAGESVRGRGLPYVYASTFSFPPENLLTLIAPG